MNHKDYILIYPEKRGWKYSLIDTIHLKFEWKKASSIEELQGQVKKISSMITANIIILPPEEEMNNSFFNNIILITKSTKELFDRLFPNNSKQLWEIDEYIDPNGKVVKELSEPEINKALRHIFRNRSKEVTFLLMNSVINPLHQSNIKNVLHTAGIKSKISSLRFNQAY